MDSVKEDLAWAKATDQTRLAIDAQRADLEASVAQLRDALDLPKRFRENPVPFIAVGAGAVFLLAGGPVRIGRFARRRLMRTTPEKAYDGLPKTLQKWVDEIASGVGPRAEDARESLAAEFMRWRHDPKKDKKFRKELAKQMVEGPPGASRTAWKAFEAGAAIVTAALARKFVEQFLTGEAPKGTPMLDAAGTIGGAAKPASGSRSGGAMPPATAMPAATSMTPSATRPTTEAGYSSMSRDQS